MELKRFERLEWPRTENESPFLSIPSLPSIPVSARCLAHHFVAQCTLQQHDVLYARATQTFWVQTATTQRCAKHTHGSGAVRSFHRRISRSRRAPHSLLGRRALRVPPASRRAQGTLHSETECSRQTLRDRRVWKRAAAGRRASTTSTANMSEDKHTWDRVPAWDGDKRQWNRCLRDVELYLETEKLDVDFFHGNRMPSRLTDSQESTLRPSSLTQFVAQRVQTETLVRE